jgi:hypothetical protein
LQFVRFVVIDVMFAANAVIVTASQLSVLIVGVPDDVIAVTRGTNRAPPDDVTRASTVPDEFCHCSKSAVCEETPRTVLITPSALRVISTPLLLEMIRNIPEETSIRP